MPNSWMFTHLNERQNSHLTPIADGIDRNQCHFCHHAFRHEIVPIHSLVILSTFDHCFAAFLVLKNRDPEGIKPSEKGIENPTSPICPDKDSTEGFLRCLF